MMLLARLLANRWTLYALAVGAALALAWLHGRSWERSRWVARMSASEAAYDRAAARAEGLAADLARANRAREALAEELDNAARSDPDAARPALSRDSVRRLSQP